MSSYPTSPDTIRLKSRLSPAFIETARQSLDLRDSASRLQTAHPAVMAADDLRWLDFALDVVRPSLGARFMVRLFDLTVAVIGLLLLAPVMAAVAIAVRLDSPGPIIYGSPRVGHRRPEFKAWKFRSMLPDAEAHLLQVLQSDEDAQREYTTFHKLKDDPRLTTVGSFIRRTSLDELPQLFNILVGEMSVVGPRPKLLRDAEVFGPALDVVLQVKPGLTGLWQISGRNRLPVQDRVILDLDYARNRTMRGDLRICATTFTQLWRPGKHGAY